MFFIDLLRILFLLSYTYFLFSEIPFELLTMAVGVPDNISCSSNNAIFYCYQ